jgi:hypothetical protein
MSEFHDRLLAALGGKYDPSTMRRSYQTAIIFEAHRCLKDRLPSLRPFQRKLAIFDQATHLLNAADLMPHQRDEIFWRTGTSKELLNPDTMWRRCRNVIKEVEKLAQDMEDFAKEHDREDQSEHEELYSAFLQKSYEDMSGKEGVPFPARFEFTHNNTLVTYKMYYKKGRNLDPSFPPPQPREILLPSVKPPGGWAAYAAGARAGGVSTTNGQQQLTNAQSSQPHRPHAAVLAMTPARVQQHKRLEMLKEVREHLDLLQSFEGVVDEESLNKRKRELFEALPPAPPPMGKNKKQQQQQQQDGPEEDHDDDEHFEYDGPASKKTHQAYV